MPPPVSACGTFRRCATTSGTATLPAPPTLVTIERDGQPVDAVAQVTKSGHVYVFHRETGEPLFPIEERPYPPSDLVGEQTAATQPLPTLPPAFSRQQFTEADLNPYSRQKDSLLAAFRQMRTGGQFIPPSLEGTVLLPGLDGGGGWSGAGYNPTTNVLYVNANEMPFTLKMVENQAATGDWLAMGQSVYQSNCMSCHGAERQGSNFHGNAPALTGLSDRLNASAVKAVLRQGRGQMPSFAHLSKDHVQAVTAFLLGTAEGSSAEKLTLDTSAEQPLRYGFTGYRRFVDSDGYAAVKPPWGTLNAIDLNSGEILVEGAAGRVPGVDPAGHPENRYRELRGLGGDGRGADLYRSHARQPTAGLRPADWRRVVEARLARRGHGHPLHLRSGRAAVRGNCCGRRQNYAATRR